MKEIKICVDYILAELEEKKAQVSITITWCRISIPW